VPQTLWPKLLPLTLLMLQYLLLLLLLLLLPTTKSANCALL
jgi:hypothetical protein